MKKLRLHPEDLAVESFPTAQPEEATGTVQAEMAPTPPYLTCPAKTRLTDCPCTPVF